MNLCEYCGKKSYRGYEKVPLGFISIKIPRNDEPCRCMLDEGNNEE